MNIFVVDPYPSLCAQCLDDRRLNKMIVETGQLLSSALWYWGADECVYVYRESYKNHPCTKWVRKNMDNFVWTFSLFEEMIHERKRRGFGEHKSERIFPMFENYIRRKGHHFWHIVRPGEFCNCSLYKDEEIFRAYMLTLQEKWEAEENRGYIPQFTNREKPWFYDKELG